MTNRILCPLSRAPVQPQVQLQAAAAPVQEGGEGAGGAGEEGAAVPGEGAAGDGEDIRGERRQEEVRGRKLPQDERKGGSRKQQ